MENRKDQSSSTNPRLIGSLAWVGENLQSAVGNVTNEITGQNAKTSAIHAVVIGALEMKSSSEALGRRLWLSLSGEGNNALYRKDIEAVLGSARKEQAELIFDTLDADGNGDISLEEMTLTVTEIARERKAIARSMHDVGQAVIVLDRFLSIVVVVLIGIVYGKP